jgi:hypothetical protein
MAFQDSTAAVAGARRLRIDFPQGDLDDLRRRILATRWPEQETVTDDSQGVPLKLMQELLGYWGTAYDWRRCEGLLTELPNHVLEIDGLDIHFLHVRSRHEDALPLIVTHGWPGSILEQLKIIEPLTNPTAHGGDASDAFHLVIPSLPGHGFSAEPTQPGWDPVRIARAWVELMKRLGRSRSHSRSASSRTSSTRRPEAGPSVPIRTTSSTSTRSTAAATSPHGSSRSCSRRSCGRRSGRSGDGIVEARAGRAPSSLTA